MATRDPFSLLAERRDSETVANRGQGELGEGQMIGRGEVAGALRAPKERLSEHLGGTLSGQNRRLGDEGAGLHEGRLMHAEVAQKLDPVSTLSATASCMAPRAISP